MKDKALGACGKLALLALVLLAAAAGGQAGLYTDMVMADGPVGYWRLGEAPGTGVYPPNQGTAQDATAGSRPLTYVSFNSAADLGHAGAIAGDADTAVKFDGSGKHIERTLGSPSTGDFAFAAGQSFSVEYWMQSTSTVNAGMVTKGYADVQSKPWYLSRLSGSGQTGKVDFYLRDVPGNSRNLYSTSLVNDGQWHHVVGVYDASTSSGGTGGTMTLYVDGAPETSRPDVPDAPYGTNGENLAFGKHASQLYDGLLDEAAVYGQALSSAQVALHYEAGRVGYVTPYVQEVLSNGSLVGFWRLGEGPNAASAVDYSGRGNDIPYRGLTTRGEPGITGDWTNAAVRFDGVSDVLYTTDDDGDFEFAPGQSFSFEYWMQTDETPVSNVGVLTKGYDGGQYLPWYLSRLDSSGRVDMYLRDSTTASKYVYSNPSLVRLDDGEWHHVVGVYDAATAEIRLYVDAALQGVASNVPEDAYGTNARPLYLGSHGGREYAGLLDDVAIYASALSADEIASHYEFGMAPEPATTTLLAIGGLGLLLRRRRKA